VRLHALLWRIPLCRHMRIYNWRSIKTTQPWSTPPNTSWITVSCCCLTNRSFSWQQAGELLSTHEKTTACRTHNAQHAVLFASTLLAVHSYVNANTDHRYTHQNVFPFQTQRDHIAAAWLLRPLHRAPIPRSLAAPLLLYRTRRDSP
jgi:hypothetical protein